MERQVTAASEPHPRRRRQRKSAAPRLLNRVVLGRAALRLLPFALPLLVALALRLAVVPPRMELDVAPLIADEGNYIGIAQTVADGEGIPDRWIWLRPPGYPLILAGLIRLYGRDLGPPLILQAFVGALTVGGVAALAGQLWGRRAAIVAAWAAALNPSLIYYTRIVHTETLYAAAVLVAVIALARYARPAGGGGWRPIAVAGVALGGAALLRPAVVPALPFLGLWLVVRRPRAAWRAGAAHALLLVALFGATIAPNAVHNWRAYGRLIPLDTTLGYIFWLDHRDISREALIDVLAAIPNPGDRQTYALRQGLAWVAAHPRESVEAGVGNLRIFWGEPPYVVDALERRRGLPDGWRAVVNTATLLAWLLIAPAAIVAAGRARRRDPLVPLLLLAVLGPTIGVALSHHENRYLVPAVPLLIALAAGIVAPLPAAWDPSYLIRREAIPGAVAGGPRGEGGWLVPTILLALFLANAAWIGREIAPPRAAIAGHWLVARAAERLRQPYAAIQHDNAMLAWNPRLSEPYEHNALRIATNDIRSSDTNARTIAAATRALELDPENFRARAIAALTLRRDGDPAAAREVEVGGGTTAPQTLDWAWGRTTGPLPARLALDGTDLGDVRGFFGPETGEGGRPFRWMGATGDLRLAPPGTAGGTLVLTVASPRQPTDPPATVAVSVNGRPLGTVAVRRELGWNELRLPLPPDLDRSRPLLIELRAPTIRREADRRALGIALASVAIEPAP